MVARRLAHLAHRSPRASLAPSYRLALVLLLALLALAPQLGHAPAAEAATLTFTVTSTADTHDAAPGDGLCADGTGQCTVRAAVEEANAQPVGSVITITIPAGTYLLPLGTLSLTRNTVTLAGAGSSTTTLDGQGHRVLAVAVTAFAKIGGLTLRNGNAGSAPGGALDNLGLAIVSSSALVSDTAGGGGGLYNAVGARLLLVNSSVMSDTASGGGGGIINQGTLTVSGSRLSGNTSEIGGAILNQGTLTLTTSTVSRNKTILNPCCYGHGGGLFNDVGATLTVSASAIVSNTAAKNGGGLFNNHGTAHVDHSTLSSNVAGNAPAGGDGGGLYNANYGLLTVSNSTVSGNVALNGFAGGLYNSATLTVSASAIVSNTTNQYVAGGFYNTGTLTVTNSTVSGNIQAAGSPDAISNGVENFGSLAHAALIYVTVLGRVENNYAAGTPPGTLTLTGTIVAGGASVPNCSGSIGDGGYNLDSSTTCGFSQPTDLSNTNPLLGPLQNNGGPTQTMALSSGSPAIDHGGTAASGCPATDQRGLPRPDAGETQCDIGAYESQGLD